MSISSKMAKLRNVGAWRVVAVTATVAAGCVSGVVACSSSERGDGESLATSADPLQSVYIGWDESTTNRGVNLVKASSTSRKGKSTGAIRTATADGYEATCGVTFVSHNYAITAAHCVDAGSGFALNTTANIEQYNTVNLNMNKLYASDNIGPTGTDPWPNYTKTALTSADGYVKTTYSCQLKRRCNPSYGSLINCPLSGNDATNADVAMLYCSSRSTSGLNWVPVSASSETGSAIQVWWFHEVVDLATSSSDPYNPYQPYFNWYHYGNLPNAADHSANWHYNNVGLTLQPLPLVSKHNASNVNYTAGTIGSYSTNTTIPVCHGTSGSGVMLANSDALVGVVSTGGLGGTVLCANMNATTGVSMQYVNRSLLRSFTNVSEVTNNRQ